MSVAVSGQRVMCFFSLELMALEYAERHLGGEPGVRWYAVVPITRRISAG